MVVSHLWSLVKVGEKIAESQAQMAKLLSAPKSQLLFKNAVSRLKSAAGKKGLAKDPQEEVDGEGAMDERKDAKSKSEDEGEGEDNDHQDANDGDEEEEEDEEEAKQGQEEAT